MPGRRLDPKQGGLKSRKLWFGIATSTSMVVCTILAGSTHPGMAPLLPTLFGSMMAVLGLYVGGDLGHNYLVSKEQPPVIPPGHTPAVRVDNEASRPTR